MGICIERVSVGRSSTVLKKTYVLLTHYFYTLCNISTFFAQVILLSINIQNLFIYILRYSLKNLIVIDVNFHTQISSSQSEERMIFFTGEKIDMSNQNCEKCFFMSKKN